MRIKGGNFATDRSRRGQGESGVFFRQQTEEYQKEEEHNGSNTKVEPNGTRDRSFVRRGVKDLN